MQSEQARAIIERIDAIRSEMKQMILNCNDWDATHALNDALSYYEVDNTIQNLAIAADYLDTSEQAEEYREYCGQSAAEETASDVAWHHRRVL